MQINRIQIKLIKIEKMFFLPKHMPHNPCRIVSMITQPISPLHCTPKTRIIKMSTKVVWPHITTNCVTTWENRISPGETPATQLLSSRPSILSIMRAEDVRATARKNTILKRTFQKLNQFEFVFGLFVYNSKIVVLRKDNTRSDEICETGIVGSIDGVFELYRDVG